MIQRLKLWHPFLLALVPVLHVLTRNPGGSRLDDTGVVIAVVLCATGVAYLLVYLLVRRFSRLLVPVVVLAIVALCYGKSALRELTRQLPGVPAAAVLLLVLAVLLLIIRWLSRRPQVLDRANTFFTLTGLLMAGWLSFRVAMDLLHSRSLVSHSALARDLARPVLSSSVTGPSDVKDRPDVYLIVLDEYANAGVLKDVFDFDNSPFQDSLRQLGFTIPRSVSSNYVHTLLSLPSLLNFSQLTRLTDEIGAHSTDATLPNYLLENNRTVAFFKRRGYRFLFFPSQWWPSTARNRNADWQFDPWPGFNLGRAATRSDLRRSLLATTAFSVLKPDDRWDADYIRRTLLALEEVPRRPEPTFTFAHVVNPHWPYVFTADCRVAHAGAGNGREGRKRAYLEQLRCLNRLVLHTVAALVQQSGRHSIILLQGDHGSNLLRYSDAPSAASVTPAQARERFGAFGAYYLPEGGGLFADSVTVVNVLQRVLVHYFGATIAASADNHYMSLERTPYDFVQIDPTTFLPVRAALPPKH
jgi:hypothetical protein